MTTEYDLEDSPYSFGTTPIYNTLFKLLTTKDDETDIIMINLTTIVRNVSSKSTLQEEYKRVKENKLPIETLARDIVAEATKESKLLVNDIAQIFNTKTSPLPRYIFVYMGDYRKAIPMTYLRSLSTGKQHIDMAIENLRYQYKNTHNTSDLDGIKLVEIYNNVSHSLPFRWLEKEIRDLKNQHNVIMISHHPLDYHIGSYVAHWRDIKSFNGSVQTKKELGEKVLGYTCLPFTERIHILMGDKTDLKPCLNQKARKDLLAKAEKGSWNLKSKEFVDRVLGECNFITPYAI